MRIDAPLKFLTKGCPRLREVHLERERKWDPRSREHLEAFQAKLLAVNPDAEVVLDCKRVAFSSLSSFRCVFHVCLVMLRVNAV